MTLSFRIVRTYTTYLCLFPFLVAECADFVSDSYQINRVDLSPFNDAVLFNDIAEIINDFDSNMYLPLPSDSDSEENIEDLLSEYQHYLDKAHKEKKNYEEKLKSKNKVPLLRHEQYSKTRPLSANKYAEYLNSFSNPITLSERPPNNQFDLFLPFNSEFKYFVKPEMYNKQLRKINRNDKEGVITQEKQLNAPLYSKTNYDLKKSPCICKDDQIPCKKCVILFDTPFNENIDQPQYTDFGEYTLPFLSTSGFTSNVHENNKSPNRLTEVSDNDLNVRIKIDIQLPKIFESILKQKNRSQDKTTETDGKNSIETGFVINSPISKFNIPIPIDIFGLKKPLRINKHDSTSLHKITIHKKKKSKLGNSGKKHKKKIITFHKINFEPQVMSSVKIDDIYNINNASVTESVIKDNGLQPKTPTLNNTLTFNETSPKSVINTVPLANTSINTITDSTSQLPFVTFSFENKTDDAHKTDNSIETDYVKTLSNSSTELPPIFRSKRSLISPKTVKLNENNTLSVMLKDSKKETNLLKNVKELNKLTVDSELLYWPNITKSSNNLTSKNITEIILERENSKVKLNISQETIRRNHTIALEHAVFGNVDWNDVDTVAPVFMSFMGKYIRGILTFCSQKICHSMKCYEKTCVHRICEPEDRFNQRGHCTGTNNTDSVATMEAIMDLPTNVAFEIVDILQDKMLGKMFGKVTLCINTKCISLVASKKNFMKSKCSVKDLDFSGHCSNLKHSKIM